MTSELVVTILGCGSSGGVPRIGGPDGKGFWGACDPNNPKNRRRRCSILAHRGETRLLVDTSPDMREQLIDAGVGKLDAVLITHEHADQLHGLDDLRQLAINMRRRVDVWSDIRGMSGIRDKFDYCFQTPDGSDYPPILNGHVFPEPFRTVEIKGEGGAIPVRPFHVQHGRINALGFRIGDIAYSPDVDGLDDEAFAALEGVDCWIVDALRYTQHPSHAHLDRALEWIARAKPKRAVLTDMHVDLDYATLLRELPEGVVPAYDGMEIRSPL